jgi:hypothetical protein
LDSRWQQLRDIFDPMSTAFEVLRISHIVVPWLVVARRLRPGRRSFWEDPIDMSLPAPSADTKVVAVEAPAAPPTRKNSKSKNKNKKRPAKLAQKETKAAPPAPATGTPAPASPRRTHHTHYCLACRAPVPLANAPFPCPYCTVQIVPPPEVSAAYGRIAWAKLALERAERAWKRAVLWNGPLWVVLFALVIVVWSGSYLYLVIEGSGPRRTLPWTNLDRIVLMASAPSGIFGWWTGVLLATHKDGLGRVIGKVPRASFNALPSMSIACSHCGADAQFAEGRFTTVCVYCSAEEARPALAKCAAEQAESIGNTAEFSMIDAYRAIVKRRETLLKYIDLMAVCVVAMIGVEMLRWIPIVGKVFAFFE